MRRIFQTIIIVSLLAIIPFSADAQCKSFAKKSKIDLLPFVHDGIYNATVLAEGESAELYKTFYSGQEYRILIASEEELPNVEFTVMDSKRNVLFSNKDADFAKSWDFQLEASQQLIISIQVQTSDELKDEISKGCIAVMIGFMNEENVLR